LFDTIPNPIFHKDANGRYTGCNRAFLEFTGKQMEEILGKTGYDMGPKDIADKYAEKDRELFEHPGKQHYEWQVQNTLGEVREVIFDKATLLDAHCAVTGLIGVISDITDRKRAEEALRESKEYLDKILNSIGDPIFVKDRQHRYVLVNDAVNVNIGLKREDLLGRTDYDFFPKEQVDIFWENDEAVFVTGEENVNEEELTDGKGAIRTIVTKKTLYSDKAANKFIVGVIRDITDRKEAELALQAAHQQLQDIVEFLPDATFVIDREKKVIYWNRAREELTGLKKQDILGQADYAYAVPFYGERTPSLIDLVTGEKPEIEKRYDYVQRRGTTLYVETFSAGAYQGKGAYLWSTAAPLFDRCGNMIGSIQVIRDISDRKRAEEAIRQSEETIRDIAAKLRKAQEISRIGSWDWNLVTQKVEISDQVYKVTGMLPGEFDGNLETLVSRFTHPDEMETVRNYIQNAMAGNDSPPMEFRAIGPGGAVRDVWLAGELIYDASGKAVRMVGTFQDTTARKQLQESLQKAKESESSRQHLDTVLRSIGDGILTVDTGMRVTYANEGLRSICPCLQGTQIGAVLEDVPCLCGGFCFAALDRIIKTRNPVVDLRVKCKTGHNLERIVILNGSQLLAPDNQFLGAVLTVQDVTRIEELERRLLERNSFRNMIGKSEKMREIYSLIESLTDLETTVLITGESGTGKELVAEALHYGGIWSSGPLVKVNCSALPEGLLESELFGHVRGAFTNAVSNRTGRFQAAEGGTIFLDEIGDIAPLTQIKLLGVLERKEFEQVGDSKTQKARVRVVAATNVDLGEKVRRGFFREDLYYRLNVMVIHLPPLRERTEDIPFLTDYFIRQMRSVCVKNITDVSNEVMQVFMRYRWPGNIRELKHALEHACILCPTRTIALEHLPKELSEGALTKKSNVDVSAEEILEALEQTGGQKARAARVLGISRRTLYRRIEQYKINDLIQ